MKYTLIYTQRAERDLAKLDIKTKGRIGKALLLTPLPGKQDQFSPASSDSLRTCRNKYLPRETRGTKQTK